MSQKNMARLLKEALNLRKVRQRGIAHEKIKEAGCVSARNEFSAGGLVVMEALRLTPDVPSRTLARTLCAQHPKLWANVELCRATIRRLRGQTGDKVRAKVSTKEFFRKAGTTTDGYIPLPKAWEEIDPWRVVEVEFKRALLLYDVHIPFHDDEACRVALEYGRKLNPDCIIIGGDLMDFYAVSNWERDPRRRDLVRELEVGERFIEVLRDTFPKARMIYLSGNHEDRLWRYCWRNIPELVGLPELSMKELLHLDEYGVELVDGMKPLRAGPHLFITHGHEFAGGGLVSNPVNPARGLFLRAKANAICGHFHQTSQHTEPGLGHPVSTWSSGSLCSLRPQYRPINKWNHGIIHVELDGDSWSVSNKKIIGGRVV